MTCQIDESSGRCSVIQGCIAAVRTPVLCWYPISLINFIVLHRRPFLNDEYNRFKSDSMLREPACSTSSEVQSGWIISCLKDKRDVSRQRLSTKSCWLRVTSSGVTVVNSNEKLLRSCYLLRLWPDNMVYTFPCTSTISRRIRESASIYKVDNEDYRTTS
jgi:hypothetical protein